MESKTKMTLIDVMDHIDTFVEGSYIYIEEGKWFAESKVVLIPIESVEIDGIKPPSGMEYFLEIEIVKDVIMAWGFMRAGAIPSLQDKVKAVLYYAENDAYLPVD